MIDSRRFLKKKEKNENFVYWLFKKPSRNVWLNIEKIRRIELIASPTCELQFAKRLILFPVLQQQTNQRKDINSPLQQAENFSICRSGRVPFCTCRGGYHVPAGKRSSCQVNCKTFAKCPVLRAIYAASNGSLLIKLITWRGGKSAALLVTTYWRNAISFRLQSVLRKSRVVAEECVLAGKGHANADSNFYANEMRLLLVMNNVTLFVFYANSLHDDPYKMQNILYSNRWRMTTLRLKSP